jgi:ABC-type spermidine/putrescine transport system permease subunit I
MLLKAKAFALASGVFGGVLAFLFMTVSLMTGYAEDLIMKWGPLHPGFSYSYFGAVWMGILYFVVCYVGGYIFAWFYNRWA